MKRTCEKSLTELLSLGALLDPELLRSSEHVCETVPHSTMKDGDRRSGWQG